MIIRKRRRGKSSLGDQVGIGGQKRIAQSLAKLGPLEAVPKIQRENGVQVGDFEPMLGFLDHLGMRRGLIYKKLLEHLRQHLLQQIQFYTQDQKEALLQMCLPYVETQELKIVVEKVLKSIGPKFPRELIQGFSKEYFDLDLFLPDAYMHEIWEENTECGHRQLSNLLLNYKQSQEMEAKLCLSSRSKGASSGSGETASEKVSLSNRRDASSKRAGHKHNKKNTSAENSRPFAQLVSAAGYSSKLYDTLLGMIRGSLIKFESPIFCKLRLELVHGLAFKSYNLSDIRRTDPCYDIAMSLHACLQKNRITEANAKEIVSMIKNEEKEIGDFGMMLAHPDIKTLLQREIVKVLGSLVVRRILPRSESLSQLSQLSYLLLLAYRARDMVSHLANESKRFRKPKLETKPLYVFYTIVALMMTQRLLGEETKNDRAGQATQNTMQKTMNASAKASPVAREMIYPFLARAARSGDFRSMSSLLVAATKAGLQTTSNNRFMQEFFETLARLRRKHTEKVKELELIMDKWGAACNVPFRKVARGSKPTSRVSQ